MNNFPFFGFPYNNYYRYYNYRNNLNRNIKNYIEQNNADINENPKTINSSNNNYKKNNSNANPNNNSINTDTISYVSCNATCTNKESKYKNDNKHSVENKNQSSKFYLGPIIFDSSSFFDSEKPVLEILGLKLYLDDILIVSLLYFLYEEDVKDETLFISLLLLLIS